ncbi:MAG: hypothetical protein NTY64_03610, partial [Deltaproteobacteria bacterium]|nr:hypothetical protein [Deltaproteobacteria bacterium]
MKGGKGRLLFFVIGGMELCWRYAWATFLTASILNRPFPFPEALGTFALASALTLFSRGKGWRVIWVLGMQILGFLFAALRIVYAFHPGSSLFWASPWLTEFFNTPRGPLEWLYLILILVIALFFWIGGVTLARRSRTYSTLSLRFDLGIAAFFLLFLIRLLLWVKGGIRIEEPMSLLWVFPFFVFSLLAIGLVRNQGKTPKYFLPGYQGIGVIISFTLVVFLFGAGLVLFFLPYLTLSAKVGYVIFKAAAKPVVYIFVEVLRFLYMHNATRPETPSAPVEPDIENFAGPAESVGGWTAFLEEILGWVLGGLAGLAGLIVVGLAIFYLVRWLFSKTSISQRKQSSWDIL